MTRTCKTCINCTAPSYLNGAYRCTKDGGLELPETTPDHPACQWWIFSEGHIYLAFERSLQKARREHPDFCPVLTGAQVVDLYRRLAEEQRENQGAFGPQLRTVLLEEVYEFLAEVAAGNLEAAISEAGDVLAVMYRALNGDGRNKKRGERGEEASK